MGGSGSGGWSPTVPSNPCGNIRLRASVNSPQARTLQSLNLGDVLTIELQQTPSVSLIVTYNGAIVGSLTGFSMTQIINCIENGNLYSATVVELNGGNCTVQVESM